MGCSDSIMLTVYDTRETKRVEKEAVTKKNLSHFTTNWLALYYL